MVDAVGAGLGAASLAIALLDGLVKGYIFFLAVGQADDQISEIHTRLEMEQSNTLDFAQAAGLLDLQDDGDVPQPLRAQVYVIEAVFNRMQSKLDEMATLTQYNQSKKIVAEQSQPAVADFDEYSIKDKFSSLTIKWSTEARQRAHPLGTNHVRKYYQIGKMIVTDPRKLKWTAVGRSKYKALLDDVGHYNSYLRGLLQGEYLKRLEQRTRRTHLEVVLLRNDVGELRRVAQNITHMLVARHGLLPDTSELQRLERLADMKVRSVMQTHDDTEQANAGFIEKLQYDHLQIDSIPMTVEILERRERTLGLFWPHGREGSPVDIWIEWKAYRSIYVTPEEQQTSPDNLDRVQGLVGLLQAADRRAFHVPECLGFFDLRDHVSGSDKTSSRQPELFGIVYRNPTKPIQSPISLAELLTHHDRPSLTTRTKLAHIISQSVLYLNSVAWFHKSLRSDAIVFHRDPATGAVDLTSPLVAGFEYARPSSVTSNSTKTTPLPSNILYVHPTYQLDADRGPYSRVFDIYSLGIILLEIGYWLPIQDIIRPEYETDPSTADVKIQTDDDGATLASTRSAEITAQLGRDLQMILLGDHGNCRTYLRELEDRVGERYHKSVEGCLRGFIDLKTEDERQPLVALKLHKAFVDDVVDNLGEIIV